MRTLLALLVGYSIALPVAAQVDPVLTPPPNLVLPNYYTVPVGPFGGLEGDAYAARIAPTPHITMGAALLTSAAWNQETDAELIASSNGGPQRFAYSADSDFDGEHDQRDRLLDDLELIRGELPVADPVRGHLEAVLEERNPPADEHGGGDGRRSVAQMPVPGGGHERVGDDQQQDGQHPAMMTDERVQAKNRRDSVKSPGTDDAQRNRGPS
jgi:hypothetical protein